MPILVVEDNAESARLLALLLNQAGGNVRVARSAEEALGVLERFPAHVVVLDLILPRMSGVLLAQALKAAPATHDAIVIAVTVLDGAEIERQARRSGCAAFVRKPIDIHTFTQTVLNAMGEAS